MAILHAGPSAPVDLRPKSETMSEAQTHALVQDDAFEAIRMVVPKEHEVCHEHHVKGPVTVQCLEGWVALTIDSAKHSLKAGHWTFVPAGTPHTITGVEDSLVLLTVIFAETLGEFRNQDTRARLACPLLPMFIWNYQQTTSP